MKKILQFIILIIALQILLLSCSIEKRHYLAGYFIELNDSKVYSGKNEINNKFPASSKTDKITEKYSYKNDITNNYITAENLIASVDTTNLLISPENNNKKLFNTTSSKFNKQLIKKQSSVLLADSCDTIVLNTRVEILAKVLEITPDEIKYKKYYLKNDIADNYSTDENLIASVDTTNLHISQGNNNNKFFNIPVSKLNKQLIKKQSSVLLADSCDTIVLNTRVEILAKVLEITPDEIKYKRCNNLNGPTIIIKKSDVFIIKYPNGTIEYFPENNHKTANSVALANNTVRDAEILGVLGCILGVLGLLVFGVPLGFIALVLGGASSDKIKKHPEKFKGKAYGIISMILGVIDIVGVVIFLSNS
ncbi:MAG: DUF4190 domain-containing protein [Bacteroidetes bacterium]|nr:DUF4190 domain-containing protein [Bacteroidota bacterium]